MLWGDGGSKQQPIPSQSSPNKLLPNLIPERSIRVPKTLLVEQSILQVCSHRRSTFANVISCINVGKSGYILVCYIFYLFCYATRIVVIEINPEIKEGCKESGFSFSRTLDCLILAWKIRFVSC